MKSPDGPIVFPIPFPNECFSVTALPFWQFDNYIIGEATKTGAYVRSNGGYYWQAIGH